jgi:thiamine-phosphate pyrophosphorylase
LNEALRMRAAKLAAAARALQAAGGAKAAFSAAFMTDQRRIARPDLVLRALPRGTAVVYRDYDDPRRAAKGALLRSIAEARGLLFLVAGDAALAARLRADGVHLRADDMRRPARLGSLPPSLRDDSGGAERIVTAACHSAAEIAQAATLGADVAFLSPVFATPSHPGAPPLGPSEFKRLAAASPVPVLALGGVDETNAALLAGPNVAGFGAIGAFSGLGGRQ